MDRRRQRVLFIWRAQVPGDKVSVGQHHKFLSTVCGTVLGAGYQYKRIWSQKLAEEFQDRKKRLQVYNFRKKFSRTPARISP